LLPETDGASRLQLFKATIEEFVKFAGSDQALSSLLSRNPMTIEYSLPDIGMHWYIGQCGGKPVGAMGQPTGRSELVLIMDSSTLDRALRGQDVKGEIKIVTHLDLRKKLMLKGDYNRLRTALTHVYRLACEKTSFSGLNCLPRQGADMSQTHSNADTKANFSAL
jgi:hypothetical protein